MDVLLEDIKNALPSTLDTSTSIGKVEQTLQTSLSAIQELQDDNRCFILLKSGILCLIKIMHLLVRSMPLIYTNNILDLLLRTVAAAGERGSKCNGMVVSEMTESYLDIIGSSKFPFLARLEVLKSLNTIFESTTPSVTEKLSKSEHFMSKLGGLFQLVKDIGDYEFQVSVVEFLFRAVPRKSRQTFAQQFVTDDKTRNEYLKIKDSCFEVDCRKFLNSLNSRAKSERRVISIPCQDIRLGSIQLQKPTDEGYDDFWLDCNLGSKRLVIFCEQSQFSSQRSAGDDFWDALSVMQSDILKFKCREENGMKCASLWLKSKAACAQHIVQIGEEPIMSITVDRQYDLSGALTQTFCQKKVSDAGGSIYITKEISEEPLGRQPDTSVHIPCDNSMEREGSEFGSQCSQQPPAHHSATRQQKVSVPKECMMTPTSTISLESYVSSVPGGVLTNSRLALVHSQAEALQKKLDKQAELSLEDQDGDHKSHPSASELLRPKGSSHVPSCKTPPAQDKSAYSPKNRPDSTHDESHTPKSRVTRSRSKVKTPLVNFQPASVTTRNCRRKQDSADQQASLPPAGSDHGAKETDQDQDTPSDIVIPESLPVFYSQVDKDTTKGLNNSVQAECENKRQGTSSKGRGRRQVRASSRRCADSNRNTGVSAETADSSADIPFGTQPFKTSENPVPTPTECQKEDSARRNVSSSSKTSNADLTPARPVTQAAANRDFPPSVDEFKKPKRLKSLSDLTKNQHSRSTAPSHRSEKHPQSKAKSSKMDKDVGKQKASVTRENRQSSLTSRISSTGKRFGKQQQSSISDGETIADDQKKADSQKGAQQNVSLPGEPSSGKVSLKPYCRASDSSDNRPAADGAQPVNPSKPTALSTQVSGRCDRAKVVNSASKEYHQAPPVQEDSRSEKEVIEQSDKTPQVGGRMKQFTSRSDTSLTPTSSVPAAKHRGSERHQAEQWGDSKTSHMAQSSLCSESMGGADIGEVSVAQSDTALHKKYLSASEHHSGGQTRADSPDISPPKMSHVKGQARRNKIRSGPPSDRPSYNVSDSDMEDSENVIQGTNPTERSPWSHHTENTARSPFHRKESREGGVKDQPSVSDDREDEIDSINYPLEIEPGSPQREPLFPSQTKAAERSHESSDEESAAYYRFETEPFSPCSPSREHTEQSIYEPKKLQKEQTGTSDGHLPASSTKPGFPSSKPPASEKRQSESQHHGKQSSFRGQQHLGASGNGGIDATLTHASSHTYAEDGSHGRSRKVASDRLPKGQGFSDSTSTRDAGASKTSMQLRKQSPKCYREDVNDDISDELLREGNQDRHLNNSSQYTNQKFVFTQAEQRILHKKSQLIHKTFTMSVSSRTKQGSSTSRYSKDPYDFECESVSSYGQTAVPACRRQPAAKSKTASVSSKLSKSQNHAKDTEFTWDSSEESPVKQQARTTSSCSLPSQNKRPNKATSSRDQEKMVSQNPSPPLDISVDERSPSNQDSSQDHTLFMLFQSQEKQTRRGAHQKDWLRSSTHESSPKQKRTKNFKLGSKSPAWTSALKRAPNMRKEATPRSENGITDLDDTVSVDKSELSWIAQRKSGGRGRRAKVTKTYKRQHAGGTASPASSISLAFSWQKPQSPVLDSIELSPKQVAVTPRSGKKKVYSPLDITVATPKTPHFTGASGKTSSGRSKGTTKAKSQQKTPTSAGTRSSLPKTSFSEHSFGDVSLCDLGPQSQADEAEILSQESQQDTGDEDAGLTWSDKPSSNMLLKLMRRAAESSPLNTHSPSQLLLQKSAPSRKRKKTTKSRRADPESNKEHSDEASADQHGLVSGPSSIVRPCASELKRRYGISDDSASEEEEVPSSKRPCLMPRTLFPEEPNDSGDFSVAKVRKRRRQEEREENISPDPEVTVQQPVLTHTLSTKSKPSKPDFNPWKGVKGLNDDGNVPLDTAAEATEISGSSWSQGDIDLSVGGEEEELVAGVGGVSRLLAGFGTDLQKQMKTKERQIQTLSRDALKLSSKRINQLWMTEKAEREEALRKFRENIASELLVLEQDVAALCDLEKKAEAAYLQQVKSYQDYRDRLQRRVKSVKSQHESFRSKNEQAAADSQLKQKSMESQLKKDMKTLEAKFLLDMQEQQLRSVKQTLQKLFY